jgi:hypothetical protein
VLRIVAGAPMETVAAEYGISVDRLRMWRSAFIGAGRERLRSGAGDFPD